LDLQELKELMVSRESWVFKELEEIQVLKEFKVQLDLVLLERLEHLEDLKV
jgi:hypothetical protein